MELNFFYENLVSVPIVAWIVTLIFKWIYFWMPIFNFSELRKVFSSWWMPSLHSTFIASLTMSIALKHTISSDLFAICMIFLILIVYDAIWVRYQAWLHAKTLNKLLWNNLKESLWHLPSEAFAWTCVWFTVAIILFYM